MLILIFPSFVIFTIEFILFLRKSLSVFRFFTFCYATIVGLGVPMVMLIDYISVYKFQLRDLDKIQIIFIIGYVLIYIGALPVAFYSRIIRDRLEIADKKLANFDGNSLSFATKSGLLLLLILSILASMIYLAISGFSFGSSGYESRYEEASGSGPLLLFIPAFLPYAAYRLSTSKNLANFFMIAFVLILYNIFIFMLLSGYRQLLRGSALLSVIVAVDKGFVPRWTIAPAAIVIFPIIALSMSFARYSGEESTPFADQTAAALYYIQGDIFPIDAPMRIMWYCETQKCPGTTVFVSHFQKFVPRGAWPNKPKILPDSAGFYTQTILNYKRQLTLSATIMGEALLMDSKWKACLVMLLSGFLSALMTEFFRSPRPSIAYFIYLSNIYIGFFWIREGLEDAINRIFIMMLYSIIGITCASVLRGVRSNNYVSR